MTHHKQPDRFERMVMKAIKKYDDGMLNAHDAINLLRREHQWMVGMVRQLRKSEAIEGPQVVGYRVALRHIAEKLHQRRK